MNLLPDKKALEDLPTCVWFQPSLKAAIVFNGTPLEIVASIGKEIGSTDVRETIQKFLHNIAIQKKVLIRLPSDLSDEQTASLFLHALLEMKFTKPVPKC